MKNIIYFCPSCGMKTQNEASLIKGKGGCSSCGKSSYKCSKCGTAMKISQGPNTLQNSKQPNPKQFEKSTKPNFALYEGNPNKRDIKIKRV